MRLAPLYRATFATPESWSVQLSGVPGDGGTEAQSFLIAEGRTSGVVSARLRAANFPRRRVDGVLLPDFRGVLEVDDGAVVMFTWHGITALPVDGMRQLTGSMTHLSDDLRYARLNDVVCACAGELRSRPAGGFEVVLDVAELVWEPLGERPRAQAVRIDWYDGDREAIRPLFAEAEDSPVQLAAYLLRGQVLVAWEGTQIVGHLQLIPTDDDRQVVELKSMAVVAGRRGSGIGRMLVDSAVRRSVEAGRSRITVATAAADVGNLRFYQRCGFRLTGVERDAFGPSSGYPDPIIIDGIPLRDRVWLAQDLVG